MGVLTLRLPTELHQRFTEECEKRGLSASELGRKAIEVICQRMVDQSEPVSFKPWDLRPRHPPLPAANIERSIVRPTGYNPLDGAPVFAPPPGSRLKQTKRVVMPPKG